MKPRDITEALVDASRLAANVSESFDAVVVGSGAGGAVLAKELAEGGMRVALLEEGGHQHERKELASEAIVRMYRDCGLTSTIGRPIVPIPLGRCLGGTTKVNSGTFFRTPETVLTQWRERFGLDELDAGVLDQAFSRVEEIVGVAPARFSVMSRPNVLIHELLEKAGFKGAPLSRNAPECEGCGMCCYGCTCYAKQSTELSYMPRALDAGLTAYVNAKARSVLQERDGTACGIAAEALDGNGQPTGRRIELRAPIVALACGTLLTPIFLRKNRLARGNRHVGRHLTVHPANKVVAEFEERIDSWNGIPQAYYYDGLHDDGIMFEGIAMPPDLGPMAVPFSGEQLAYYIKNYAHMTTFGIMISDTAEGRLVRLPWAGYKYLYSLTPTDARRIRKASAFLGRLFLEGGAKVAHAMVHSPYREFRTLADVDRFEKAPLRPGDIEVLAFHPLGTCRMGPTARHGVCDQNHRVFGIPGLYLCDGSVVPSALGVNPQETIMALATRLAGQLLDRTLGPQTP